MVVRNTAHTEAGGGPLAWSCAPQGADAPRKGGGRGRPDLIAGLPRRENGFSRPRSYPAHRCDFVAEGVAREDGARRYDFDNRSRRNGCLFQYTLGGEGRFQALPDGKIQRIGAGMGILCPFPSATRYWLPEGGEWEFIYVIIDGDMAYDLVGQLVKEAGHVWRIPPDHASIECQRSLHLAACEGERAPDEFESSALAHRFLMELFRLTRTPRDVLPSGIETARAMIERNYADPELSVDDLASQAGWSKFHFARQFKACLGRGPHAYLMDLRLSRAAELVASTSKPIKEVAHLVGYRDYAYFCKEFKRRFKRNPLAVRRLGARLSLDLDSVLT